MYRYNPISYDKAGLGCIFDKSRTLKKEDLFRLVFRGLDKKVDLSKLNLLTYMVIQSNLSTCIHTQYQSALKKKKKKVFAHIHRFKGFDENKITIVEQETLYLSKL